MTLNKNAASGALVAIVPAAGVGKRMLSACPKQYLHLDGQTILEHTVHRLLSVADIQQVIIAISEEDGYFADTGLQQHPQVTTVYGGKERVDSVLAGLKAVDGSRYPWVLVHDAARPCVPEQDINALISRCRETGDGGLLAYPVRDTMKRGDAADQVLETVEREALWHALTPQMYPVGELQAAIEQALADNMPITDESSAMEHAGHTSVLVQGSSENLKITRPDDLAMAEFILIRQQKNG
ncbi:2-C-methyl-D-erythritol 4-phosphate cytidylyltransferase [Thalassomonas viridans]|uniref:2-C-methyl-D-erythritol 4-phosphate cytidylyltransferase n=1 Tax=Thalassomonas viridans TaxID=137584 RepID=A0AAF0CAK0_9GAMM|nr:2-C-methyl-D-erythritol 4-phosphate cytidylyltransferase [Thalassomonas viridans]WDE06390.1 2-C-methyl-D-erythritol 4-phosphate cytidylyltransferase [Thalassomonas viridans]